MIQITITDEMIEQGKKGVAARLRWASIHWGAECLHADAIPHIARAALEAAAPLIAAQAIRDTADELRRLDDGRTGGYYEAGRHIIRRFDALADRIEQGGQP